MGMDVGLRDLMVALLLDDFPGGGLVFEFDYDQVYSVGVIG